MQNPENTRAKRDEPWSLDLRAGHAASGVDLHVNFDPIKTKSGAIRAVGPFGQKNMGDAGIKQQIRNVTLALEKELNGYVVWGEYHEHTEFEELTIQILDHRYGFVPNIAFRSLLFFSVPCDLSVLSKEWTRDGSHLRHKSNLLGSSENARDIDLGVTHPFFHKTQLEILKGSAEAYFGRSDLRIAEKIEGWTAREIKQARF